MSLEHSFKTSEKIHVATQIFKQRFRNTSSRPIVTYPKIEWSWRIANTVACEEAWASNPGWYTWYKWYEWIERQRMTNDNLRKMLWQIQTSTDFRLSPSTRSSVAYSGSRSCSLYDTENSFSDKIGHIATVLVVLNYCGQWSNLARSDIHGAELATKGLQDFSCIHDTASYKQYYHVGHKANNCRLEYSRFRTLQELIQVPSPRQARGEIFR